MSFAGGCTLDAAETVCAAGGEQPAVLDELAAPVASSLLRLEETPAAGDADISVGAPRVTMLETIREYDSERLEAQSEAVAAGQRHAAYYLSPGAAGGAGACRAGRSDLAGAAGHRA